MENTNKANLKRCEFCTELQPGGQCFWGLHSNRRPHCEKALKRMERAMSGKREGKKGERHA